jgi:hypothetical protein
MSTDHALEHHRKLVEKGWIRRFTAEEPRLSEMKELYESLGLEVIVTSATPEEAQECADCFDTPEFQDRYKTIYTRGEANPERTPQGICSIDS